MKTLQGRDLSDNGAIRIQSTRDIEKQKVKIEYKGNHGAR